MDEHLNNVKLKEELINNLIETDFISLRAEELSKYNYEDLLKDTTSTMNTFQDLTNLTPTGNDNNQSSEQRQKERLSRKSSSSSSEEGSLITKDIPKKYLENPIDFVNYFEFELPNEKINKMNKKFILKSYEEKNDIKYEVMNIKTDKDINKIIFGRNKLITVIFYYGCDYLITGNILGEIRIYSLFVKNEIKFIESPFVRENNNIKITAMDLSKDAKIIFIGYSNGNIAFAEIKSQKIKLLINDVIKESECLSIKFINQEGKFYRIITSDQQGNVFLIKIKYGFTGCKLVESHNIYKTRNKNNPIYFIKILEFNKDFCDKNSFLKNIEKYIILGSLENISIFSLDDNSELNFEHKIEKPEWIQDYVITDVCFGVGQHPQSREDLDDNDDDTPQILMCTCFNDVIYLYIIPIDNNQITEPVLIGHYFNINEDGINQIVRIGFLSKGCIYLIDRGNHFKILNTRKFMKGYPNINSEMSIINKDLKSKYKKAEIQEVYLFNSPINFQFNIKSSDSNYKQNYMNSIVQDFESNNIAVLCNNSLYIIDYIDYVYCLQKLQKNQKWLDMFILGIEFYKGKITALKMNQKNIEERKKIIREFLEQLIYVYIIADDLNRKKDSNNDSYYENQKSLKHTEDKIEIIIEFCMEIEGFDFLLDKIFKIYESRKLEDTFLTKLESFIMCDKLLNYKISVVLILKLIELYEGKNKIKILDTLLLHIDIKTLLASEIIKKIKELNLFSPIININVNGVKPDYFKPVLLMYEKYEKSEKLDFFSYEKIIEKKSLEEIKESKEYKGHKIFWYIYKCFTKRKFPYFNCNMEEYYYNKYLLDLFFWLLKENMMKNLIEINSEYYFDVLNKIFNEPKNFNILKSLNKVGEEKVKIKKLNEENYNYTYTDLSPFNLLNYIIEKGKNIELVQKMKLDFNIFIIQCHKIINTSKDILIDSIIFILDVYNVIYKTLDHKAKRVIMTINNILNNNELFTISDYEKLLIHFNSHLLDEVKAFICEKIKKYKMCLETFLDEKCIIYNKEIKLKEYIYKIFGSLKNDQDNEMPFLDFKNLVLNNIANIGQISRDIMINIINDFFDKTYSDNKLIIKKLEKFPKLQLLYIEPKYNRFIEDYNEENKNNTMIDQEEIDFVQLILGLYIKLLCITDQKEKVLPSLKKSYLFPYDLCIKLCEEYDLKDALIYLYQISGDFKSALKTSHKMIDIYFNLIIENLKSDIFNNKEFLDQINDFNESINQNLEILTEMQNHKTEEEKYLTQSNKDWFDTLDKLYVISSKFENEYSSLPSSDKNIKIKSYFEDNLLDNMRLALEKMNPFISIEQILEEVSKHKMAGYKEFKPLLHKIFESYDIQNSILSHSSNLLKNLCFEDISKFNEKNKEGNFVDFNKCSICGNLFKNIQNLNDKKILVFNCGHKMHLNCSKTEKVGYSDNFICPICIKKEIDLDIFNLTDIKINETNIQAKKKPIKLNRDKIDINMYREGFVRMKDIDNNLINKNKNFYKDCIKSRERIQYKKYKTNLSKKKKQIKKK